MNLTKIEDLLNRDPSVPINYRQAVREALVLEMDADPSVFLMGEEVGLFDGAYKVSEGLLDRFGPNRVYDTPISEEGFVGAGVGAAMLGQRPVVEIMTLNFILVAMDQVINHAAKIGAMFGGQVRCPLVIRTPAGSGNQLTAQHSQSFETWFAGTPGMKVVAPATPADAKGLLLASIRDNDPVLFVEYLPIYGIRGSVPTGNEALPIGKAQVLHGGNDITVVSHGYTTVRVQKLIEDFESRNISVELVDLRSLRPLDMETVAKSVQKTNRVLVAEEGWASYGVSAELTARIQEACFDYLDAPIQRLGALEVPLPYAKNLETAASPNADRIKQAIEKTLSL